MISRWLFRDDIVISRGTTMTTFDDVSKKDDRMLISTTSLADPSKLIWTVYRMTQYDNLSWGWYPMTQEEVDRYHALLLLQP